MSLFQVTQIAAASVPNPPVGTYTLFLDTADGLWKKKDSAGNVTAVGAEINTASNVGTAGVGVFKQKTGADLEFKKINAGSSKITITDDTGTSELDVDVNEANFTVFSGAGTKGLVPDPTSATGKVLSDNASWVAPSSLYSANGTLAGARTVNMNSLALGFTNAAAGIAIGAATADASAILDLTSTTEGFALPRMTTTQMNAIGSPIEGLMVWDNTTNDLKAYDGDNWIYLGGKLEQVYGIYTFTLSGNTDNLGNSGSNTTPTITPTIHNVTNVYRVAPTAANHQISGILAPPSGVNRVIHISNVDTTDDIEFMDDNSSVAADGILLRDSANKKIKGNETASFWYDHVISRWKVFNRVG